MEDKTKVSTEKWTPERQQINRIVTILAIIPVVMLIIFVSTFTVLSGELAGNEYQDNLSSLHEWMQDSLGTMEEDILTEKNRIETESPDLSDDEVESQLSEYVNDYLQSAHYSNEANIMVADLLNSEGGADYAKVLADTRTDSQVGETISTQDSVGDEYPDEAELKKIVSEGYDEGVRADSNDDADTQTAYVTVYNSELGWILRMYVPMKSEAAVRKSFEGQLMRSSLMVSLILDIVLSLLSIFVVVRSYKKDFAQYQSRYTEMRNEFDHDVMTLATSRRRGTEILQEEFRRQKQEKVYDTLVVMLDLDDFRKINNAYGHTRGDEIIVMTAKALRAVVRGSDEIIRWGGDEFLCIYRGIAQSDVDLITGRIRQAVGKIIISDDKPDDHLNVSIGTSFYWSTDKSYKDVVRRADRALYDEKEKKHLTK